jgi:hypothetical protein
MEFRTNNRSRSTTTQPVAHSTEATSPLVKRSFRFAPNWIVIAIICILIILAGLGFFLLKATSSSTEQAIKHDGYQAVFLTNNQVYFGHLTQTDQKYLVMKNVYYLQVQQSVQPQKDDATANQTQQASLSKLGSEVHGPEDTMYISRDQVLFWENLKDDSQVVKAIKEQQK